MICWPKFSLHCNVARRELDKLDCPNGSASGRKSIASAALASASIASSRSGSLSLFVCIIWAVCVCHKNAFCSVFPSKLTIHQEVYSLEVYYPDDPPRPNRPKAGLGLVIMMMMVTQHIPAIQIPNRWESDIMMNGGNMTVKFPPYVYVNVWGNTW